MASIEEWDSVPFKQKLSIYYQRLFPSKLLVDWMSYGDSNEASGVFCNREISFTILADADEIYIRYLSYANHEAFLKDLLSKIPVKIDIGAVFTSKPNSKQNCAPEAFKPVQKEIVFDIDLTDYDSVRTCCNEANICHKCWKFMRVAVCVIDDCLRMDFGFKHLLWVYSGRRGIHCWVCDERARTLSNEGRSAVAEWLHVVLDSTNSSKKTNVYGKTLHPSIQRAVDRHLLPAFKEIIVEDQGILNAPETWIKILSAIPDDACRSELEKLWSNPGMTANDRWDILLNAQTKLKNLPKKGNILHEIVLALLFPRLDINVSRQLNHLLKAPFCVHPKTGRVCVPIDPAHALTFDPMKVPTINELLYELNDYEKRESAEKSSSVPDYEKTEMREAIAIFQNKFLNSLLEECAASRSRAAESKGKRIFVESEPVAEQF